MFVFHLRVAITANKKGFLLKKALDVILVFARQIFVFRTIVITSTTLRRQL